MLDRAVLAGCIHGLEDEQQRPSILGVKHVLLLGQPLSTLLKEFGRLALPHLQPAGFGGIIILQLKSIALGNAEPLDVLVGALEDLFSGHRINLPAWVSDSSESLLFPYCQAGVIASRTCALL